MTNSLIRILVVLVVGLLAAGCSSPPPLRLADFDDLCGVAINQMQDMGATEAAPGSFTVDFGENEGRECSAQMAYDFDEFSQKNWASFWLRLKSLDLTSRGALFFDVKADLPPETARPAYAKVEMKRANESEMAIKYFPLPETGWETIRMDLADFGPTGSNPMLSSLEGMETLVFTFEDQPSGRQGEIRLDNIAFESTGLLGTQLSPEAVLPYITALAAVLLVCLVALWAFARRRQQRAAAAYRTQMAEAQRLCAEQLDEERNRVAEAQSLCTEQLAEERNRAAEAHRRFIRHLDHEVRTPVTTMGIGLANISSAADESGRDEAIANLVKEVEKVAELLTGLRKLAMLESQSLLREPVNMADIATEAVQRAKEHKDVAQRVLTLSVPAAIHLPDVQGDGDLLFMAIDNLLDNARKYTADNGHIDVRVYEDTDGTAVIVEVADNGMGIPEDELPFVGEELFRGKGAKDNHIPGSGLGLAFVHRVMELHGGKLTFRSRVGEGSRFYLTLPIPPS